MYDGEGGGEREKKKYFQLLNAIRTELEVYSTNLFSSKNLTLIMIYQGHPHTILSLSLFLSPFPFPFPPSNFYPFRACYVLLVLSKCSPSSEKVSFKLSFPFVFQLPKTYFFGLLNKLTGQKSYLPRKERKFHLNRLGNRNSVS